MIGTNGISIHTTRKVVTDIDWDKAHKKIISIHTTRKVVTWRYNKLYEIMQFQSTPPARW